MGLKDKLKAAWSRVSDLEDDGAAAREHASTAERIPYKDISRGLKELMKKNVDVVGRKILIPSYYVIYFSEYDRDVRQEVEEVLCDELKEELYPEMRKINPEQNKREITIEIMTDSSLAKGSFRIDYNMKKPSEAGGKAHDKTGDRPEPPPAVPHERDLKETVIEQPPPATPDEQPTIIQAAATDVRIKLVVDSGTDKNEVTVPKAKASLGRESQDDVVLESPDFSISRGHASIELRDGNYFLLPSGVNGTFLNGRELELQKEVAISPGDEIKIANYTISVVE